MLENLQRLPIEIVHSFLEKRNAKSCGIKESLANYILEINEAYNLHKKYRNISECARQLHKVCPKLSLSACKERVYDSIQFFNADCSVTSPAWNAYFADKMMDLADINLTAHNFSEVRRCFERAHEYRLAAAENRVDPKRIQFKHQIVSADMHLSRMGISVKGIMTAYQEGKKIITSRDIAPTEKDRLMNELRRELNVQDIDHEEI